MNAWNGKKWYCYGTSLTSDAVSVGRIGWRRDGSPYQGRMGYYVEHLANLSGMEAHNFGKGGTGIVPSLHPDDNVKKRVMTLEDGKAEADLISVEIIPNDYGKAPLGTPEDQTDETFLGNLNQIISYLKQNTRAKIIILIAVRARYSAVNGPDEPYPPDSEYTKGGIEWERAVEALSKIHGVPCFNAAANAGLEYDMIKDDDGKYYNDNIHLASEGGFIIANYFWERLKDISPME